MNKEKFIRIITIAGVAIATLASLFNLSIAIENTIDINNLKYEASQIAIDYNRKEIELDKKYKIDNSISEDTYYKELTNLRIEEKERDVIFNSNINIAEFNLVSSIKNFFIYGFIAFILFILYKTMEEV